MKIGRQPHFRAYLGALITGVILLATTAIVEQLETKRYQEETRAKFLSQISTQRARLESSINSRFLLIDTLMAYVSSHPEVTQEEFSLIARILVEKYPGIRSITLAKDSTISHIYPVEGNESALGLNLMETPRQKEAVERSIREKQPIVAGPVKLVQGGVAFISRTPIFLTPPNGKPSSGEYWGQVSIALNTNIVYQDARLFDVINGLSYSLRGRDGLGDKGEIFFGRTDIFAKDPVLLSVTLPNGSWQLAAAPAIGWPSYSPLSLMISITGNAIAILGSVFVFILISAPTRLQMAIDKATAALSKTQQALAKANEELEEKVQERTAQLAHAHEEITALYEMVKTENLRMSAELNVVRQMQEMILPNAEELDAIEELDIAVYMKPADEVGGDYYDVLCHGSIVTIGIGDVTGHGLESGILMIMTQTAVRTLKEIQETNPVRFLDTLNRTLYQNVQRMKSEKNLTLAILNYCNGRVSISGQHEEVVIVRSQGKLERIDTVDLGFPIGLDHPITEFINHRLVELKTGDGLVLYTDGITEAENSYGEFYGLERLCEIIGRNWHQPSEEIKKAAIADLYNHIGKSKIFDDITLLIIKQK